MAKPVTSQDVFDMWQKMVNPGAYPLQSLMFPVLDPKELQKKIAELEVVEHWLNANLNMLKLTIQSLQYQLAMLKGGEKAQEVLAGKDAPQEGEVPNPAAWAWKMMAEASRGGAAAAMKVASEETPKPKPKRRKKPPG
ncbi:MAG: hypothetical protein H7Y14_11740 [Burkholderiales bacterium]|nr:hypothetical protein [Burkholderiales bacterium]